MDHELEQLVQASDWDVVVQDGPQQQNSWDCGVFVMATAKVKVFGEKVDFTQRDVEHYFRRKCLAECVAKHVDALPPKGPA